MFSLASMRRQRTCLGLALFYSSVASAELFYTATSPAIQDGFVNRTPTTCLVKQDGSTTSTFPWTHEPTCVDAVLSNGFDTERDVHQTFCVYTNSNYNNGRGVSLVVSPEVAASFTSETFSTSVGGLEDQVGEEMGMWEVKNTAEMGKGLFAKNDIALIFAGESVIVQTPVLFISKQLLETPATPRRQLVLNNAIDQLPEATRKAVLNLSVPKGGDVQAVAVTNGITVKWPWADDVPELLAITPEVARINHACRPNALWRFNDYSLAFEVFALKNIQPGEEITLSYGFETRAYGRRKKSIEENLGFSCRCRLCSSGDDAIDASNERLSEIKALKSVIPTDPKDSPRLLGLLPKLIKEMEEEDLIFERPMYEEMLAYAWSSFGKEDQAKYWAGRARRHWAVLSGKESWQQKECANLEDNVTGHSTWKSWKGDPLDKMNNQDQDNDQ